MDTKRNGWKDDRESRSSDENSSGKRWVAAGVFLAFVAFAGAGIWAYWGSAPPETAPNPVLQRPEDRAAYIASDRFKSLPEEEKREYFRKSMEDGGGRAVFGARESMTEEQRDKLRENTREVFESIQKERVDAFFELQTPEEKVAYLDKQIDEMEKRRQEWRERREREGGDQRPPRREENATPQVGQGQDSGRPEGARRERGGTPNLDRMKQRIETTDPKDRAKATEYRMLIRARMEQRGIQPRGGGPGGGGSR
jgi:hypothetical protein